MCNTVLSDSAFCADVSIMPMYLIDWRSLSHYHSSGVTIKPDARPLAMLFQALSVVAQSSLHVMYTYIRYPRLFLHQLLFIIVQKLKASSAMLAYLVLLLTAK